VPSASSPVTTGLVVASLLAALAGAGCDTTQQKAARLRIQSKRVLAGREGVKVKQVDHDVVVVDATVLKGDGDGAIAVTLRNDSDGPVNDLPVLVGVRTPGGKDMLLNEDKGPYFQAHIPALAAGEQTTWVYTSKDALPNAGEAFAKVGVAPSEPVATATEVPQLAVSAIHAHHGKVEATVSNDTDFPQYDLAVYAWAEKNDKYVAAGRTTAGDLDAGESDRIALRLIGDADDADVHVSAPPTIFE
jgi:hypothetical protein